VFLGISKACVFVLEANYPGETKEKKEQIICVTIPAEKSCTAAAAAGAASRPGHAIISTQPIWPARH
jgi:hypothetical protein